MENLIKQFEKESGIKATIESDLYADGEIYAKEYTEWLEKRIQALSMSGVMAKLPTTILFEKVTRVEVIDQNGRSYKNPKPAYNIEIQLQDDERTLKVFIGN